MPPRRRAAIAGLSLVEQVLSPVARFAPPVRLLWSTGFRCLFGLLHAPLAFPVRPLSAGAGADDHPGVSPSRALAARTAASGASNIGVAGLLVTRCVHLGGVFVAISMKLPAGVASLIVGLQPLLTATVAGRLFRARTSHPANGLACCSALSAWVSCCRTLGAGFMSRRSWSAPPLLRLASPPARSTRSGSACISTGVLAQWRSSLPTTLVTTAPCWR